jgi:hypothetical protein
MPFLDVGTPILKNANTKIADEAFKDGDPMLHLPAFYSKMPTSAYKDISCGFAPIDRDSPKILSVRQTCENPDQCILSIVPRTLEKALIDLWTTTPGCD